MEPLSAVTASHVAQVQLQLDCTEAHTCILQSYVPETKQSNYFLIKKNEKYFLIKKNEKYLTCFTDVCNAIINDKEYNAPLVEGVDYTLQLYEKLIGHIPTFESMLIYGNGQMILHIHQSKYHLIHLSKQIIYVHILSCSDKYLQCIFL